MDPITALADLLDEEKEHIARLWAKRLMVELHELELPSRDLRAPLAEQIKELARLLSERGEDALRLWPESIRAHGMRRFDQRFEADDLVREYKVLQEVLIRVYARRHGRIEPEVAEALAELLGEASAGVQASFARVLRTEEVRFREAALMESVLHQVDVGILLVEVDGTLSYATPPVARLLGLPIRTLVGARASESLGTVLAQLNARSVEGEPFRAQDMPYRRVLEQRQPVRGVQMVIDHPSGEEVILELSATALWADDVAEGVLVGVIQTMTDRTETARKTRELSEAYEALRRLQGRLLQRTRTQALGQLASGTAHALNNQLNVLRLRLTLLRREFSQAHLDALDQMVGGIGELVARLQEFAVHRTEEELEDVELDKVVREALTLVRPELPESPREAPLVLDARLEVPGVLTRVDAGLLREVLINLLLAARDRMPRGGKLVVQTFRRDQTLELRITDTGRPYGTDELSRLFDPLKGTSRTPQLSLMLAVARNQVQRWGGELSCENGRGEPGGSFEVRLPVAKARAEDKPVQAVPVSPPPPPRKRQATRRVLVVDDDLDNARMMAEVLSDEGYEVKVAHSGERALQLWDAEPFDAGLLDALMPDLSGWELAAELRRRAPGVLLAIVTGADVRGQNRSTLALVDAVFRKPVDLGALDEFLSQPEVARAGEREPALHA